MEEDIDKLEELLKEFEVYGDLDGIQDIRPYMKAIENLIKGYKDSEDIMKQTVKENLEYKQYIRELEEKNKKVIKFCKDKSTFQTFGNEEMKHILETYINRLKHRIIDILEDK